MEGISRKELKKSARATLKTHYWFLVLVCLIAGVLGTKYQNALSLFGGGKNQIIQTSTEIETNGSGEEESITFVPTISLNSAYEAVLKDQSEDYQENILKKNKSKGFNIGILQIGRQRGVLANVINHVNSSTLFLMGYAAFHSMTDSRNISLAVAIFLSFIVFLLNWIFIAGLYEVVMGRIFMESRIYEHIPAARFVYLIRYRRWIKVALALFRRTVYELLWGFTLIGGLIKKYSYFCVPYILAENPDVTGKEAILLSRKMMDGHKWECFKLEFSFILWNIVNMVCMGLPGLFFLNPYKSGTFTEYFVTLRNNWKKEGKEGSEYFNDTYLYEAADPELLKETYSDIHELQAQAEEYVSEGHSLAKFIAKNFGIILKHSPEEQKYLKSKSLKQRLRAFLMMSDGKMYPSRLSPIPEKEKDPSLEGMGYERCYTIVSMILIFFSVCIIGWLWEVTLHLISDHEFVNRGVLHGPWLPIYGTGGMVIMIFLNRFRSKFHLEFILSMVLAGFVEYMTAWHLENTYHEKWWSYTGYFLNLHGRVCAEGLIIFGLGGMAIVYLVAPLLDNQFRKIPKNIALILCAVLIVSYVGDSIYSKKHPNKGDGITNYSSDSGQQKLSDNKRNRNPLDNITFVSYIK